MNIRHSEKSSLLLKFVHTITAAMTCKKYLPVARARGVGLEHTHKHIKNSHKSYKQMYVSYILYVIFSKIYMYATYRFENIEHTIFIRTLSIFANHTYKYMYVTYSRRSSALLNFVCASERYS